MRINKITAVSVTAALLASAMSGISSFAEEVSVTVEPSFTMFNALDVNGSIIINLPEGVSANVNIYFDSPESTYGYYNGVYGGDEAGTYVFDIEGNEDRTYYFEMSVTEVATELGSQTYTESMTLPEGGDNPDSWVNYIYNVSIEQNNTDIPYVSETTVTNVSGGKNVETDITLYVSELYLTGDVNDDGVIDAIDASMVLAEYALLATAQDGTFNESQQKAADVNEDSVIDAIDASKILTYYAASAAGQTPSWD